MKQKPMKEPNWRCECGAVNLAHPDYCWRCNQPRKSKEAN